MKFTLSVLALACFVGALQAHPLLQQVDDDDAYGSFIELVPEALPNFEEEHIVPFPSTTRPVTTTTTSAPTTTTTPTPTTTTGAPTSTQKPTRPPQIHHNALKSQGPFSGRLNNAVLNREGVQKTAQRNRIMFNINSLRKALDDFSENETSE